MTLQPRYALTFCLVSPNFFNFLRQDFIPKLQDHLLGRLLNKDFDGDDHDFTDHERNSVRLVNNCMYQLKTLRVNYTTYDIRRDYDVISPRNHPFVMCRSPDPRPNAHPFWYAAVLGVFTADVFRTGAGVSASSPTRTEFLWVRWLGVEEGFSHGRKTGTLPRLGFIPDSEDDAFGFLDPSLVIRGSHLIPAFSLGRTNSLLQTSNTSLARPDGRTDDWLCYYAGM